MSSQKPIHPLDLKQVRTVPLDRRPSLVEAGAFARVTEPGPAFDALREAIPEINAGLRIRELASAISLAHTGDAPVILGMGAHVIKVGLSPLVIDLMERGIVTAIAMNGAGIIHDLEIATVGRSSEDVGAGLDDGSFGMARETAEEVNGAAKDAVEKDCGLGRAVGERIIAAGVPHENLSILAACARLDIPATIHVAIGSDIVHMHPSADGAAIGEASMADFRTLAAVVSTMSGGVYLNIGSAVVLPEVFLKALNLARNVGKKVENFTTANLDQISHYRPTVNVLGRPGGKAIELVGHHEILLPLLRLWVLAQLEGNGEVES